MTFNRSSTILLDFQYCLGNKKQLFPKELAYMQPDAFYIRHIHFAPPYPEKELDKEVIKQNLYNKKNINQLDWNYGETPYIYIKELMQQFVTNEYTVLVKGPEKKKFLEQYLDNIELIDMPGSFEKYTQFKHRCPIHFPTFSRCAVNHVAQMFVHMEKTNQFE